MPRIFASTASRWFALTDLAGMARIEDARVDYNEIRHRTYGFIDGLAYCFVFTVRNENVRAISLRRAHDKEMKRYVPQER